MKKNIGRLSQVRERGANEMELVKSERFAGLDVGFYQDENNEIYMTRIQIGEALEYSNPQRAMSDIHNRNKERLDDFSVVRKLRSADGKLYDTHLYNEKGIYEIMRKSNQPKADEFYDFVYNVISGLRKGELTVRQPMSTKDLLLQASLEHELRIEKVEKDVHTLIHETPIRNHQQVAIEKARKKVVLKALGGKKSNAYEELSRKVFSEIGRDFKDRFNVPRYNELPQSRYEEGLAYISRWRPSTNTQVLIDEANGQAVLWGDSE